MGLNKLKLIADAIMARHTLFSLPFAATAVLLETGGHPPLKQCVLILIAAAAARNAANALNRVIDADIDKKNLRTAKRHIPQGLLSKKTLLIFSLVMGLILFGVTCFINLLCVLLLPFAIFLVGLYSFTKRWTWFCHYWLGLACSCSVMGSFLAISGHFALRYFPLTLAHCLWVAGFDIIYALQDIEFDRREHLHSIPARFGATRARIIAAASHALALAGFLTVPLFWRVSHAYIIAASVAGALLATEHLIALGKTPTHIRIASYSINEILPLLILAGVLISSGFVRL